MIKIKINEDDRYIVEHSELTFQPRRVITHKTRLLLTWNELVDLQRELWTVLGSDHAEKI